MDVDARLKRLTKRPIVMSEHPGPRPHAATMPALNGAVGRGCLGERRRHKAIAAASPVFHEFPKWMRRRAARCGIKHNGEVADRGALFGRNPRHVPQTVMGAMERQRDQERGGVQVATVLVLASRKQHGRGYARAWRKGRSSPASTVRRLWSHDDRFPCTEILLHYGFDGSRESEIARAFDDYIKAGLKAVYVDLGYFKNRAALGRYTAITDGDQQPASHGAVTTGQASRRSGPSYRHHRDAQDAPGTNTCSAT